jgi:hypothetical protein
MLFASKGGSNVAGCENRTEDNSAFVAVQRASHTKP